MAERGYMVFDRRYKNMICTSATFLENLCMQQMHCQGVIREIQLNNSTCETEKR